MPFLELSQNDMREVDTGLRRTFLGDRRMTLAVQLIAKQHEGVRVRKVGLTQTHVRSVWRRFKESLTVIDPCARRSVRCAQQRTK